METNNKQENQAYNYSSDVFAAVLNKQEREIFIQAVTGMDANERTDQLANFIISLLMRLREDEGAQHVQTELELTIEELFKRSDAFCLALDLYAGRFQLRSGKVEVVTRDLETILRTVIDAKLRDPQPPQDETPAPTQDTAAWAQSFAAMAVRLSDRLEGAIYEAFTDEVLELTDAYTGTVKGHIEYLLPAALECEFSTIPDTIALTLQYGKKKNPLARIVGNVTAGFETLLLGLNEICKPYAIRELLEIKPEELKTTWILSVGLEGDSETTPLHKQELPFAAIPILEKFLQDTFQSKEPIAAPAKTTPPAKYNLCEYEKLTLSFKLNEKEEDAFEIRLDRAGDDDADAEINFKTEGVNRTFFNRDRLQIPLKIEHKGTVAETLTLNESGEVHFLGYKGAQMFGLRYDNADGEFEGYFDVYDAKGDCVQSLIFYI